MKPLFKIFFVIVLLLVLIFPVKISNGCFDPEPPFVGYSILHPNISEGKVEKPIVFTYTYFGGYWQEDKHVEKNLDKNIEEWRNYFCGKPKMEDLSFVIYKSSISDLEKIRSLQTDTKITIPDTLKNNSFVQTFSQYKFPDFLDYLIFAKECEPHLTGGHYWKKDISTLFPIDSLLEKGVINYHNIKDDFLKLRYGYQILRLSRQLNKDLEITYNQFIKPLEKVESVIQNLSTEHLGGWLSLSENQQKSIHGNVLLAKSLIGNLDRGRNVYIGFNIKNQKEWNQTMAACENSEQRSLVHYLRALEKHSVALDDMKSMYNLHPKSKALEILMTREMQKVELKYLKRKVKNTKNWTADSKSKYGLPDPYILDYIKKIKPFVKKVTAEKKCNNLSFWMMMDGYLEYLSHDHRMAQTIFSKAKKEAKKETVLHDQIELLEFANMLSLINTMDEEMEIKFGKIMKNNRAFVKQWRSNPDFFMEKMASLYAQKGDFAKAYLCNYEVYGLKFYPNSKDAKAVLDFFDKVDKNDFEKYILKDEEIKSREDIVDILGTSYLGEGQIEKAIETFATIPNFGKKFKNPFRIYFYEIGMKKKYPQVKEFSKYEIAQKILELKNEISQNPTTSAEAHLALGCYEYYSSFFGYGWQIKDYFITGRSWSGEAENYYWHFGKWTKGNKEFMNLSVARKHLKSVFELTDDRELHAQATLLLAQFEKINNTLKNIRAKNKKEKEHHSKYYVNRFENDYYETSFYQLYLKECGGLDSY